MASAAILQSQAPTGHVEKLLADTCFQSYMPDSLFQKKGLEAFYQNYESAWSFQKNTALFTDAQIYLCVTQSIQLNITLNSIKKFKVAILHLNRAWKGEALQGAEERICNDVNVTNIVLMYM